jgi:hypothetical protein
VDGRKEGRGRKERRLFGWNDGRKEGTYMPVDAATTFVVSVPPSSNACLRACNCFRISGAGGRGREQGQKAQKEGRGG